MDKKKTRAYFTSATCAIVLYKSLGQKSLPELFSVSLINLRKKGVYGTLIRSYGAPCIGCVYTSIRSFGGGKGSSKEGLIR